MSNWLVSAVPQVNQPRVCIYRLPLEPASCSPGPAPPDHQSPELDSSFPLAVYLCYTRSSLNPSRPLLAPVSTSPFSASVCLPLICK